MFNFKKNVSRNIQKRIIVDDIKNDDHVILIPVNKGINPVDTSIYIGYGAGNNGDRIPRYMNEYDAKHWHMETGHPIEKI